LFATTPPVKIEDFDHLPLHRGGFCCGARQKDKHQFSALFVRCRRPSTTTVIARAFMPVAISTTAEYFKLHQLTSNIQNVLCESDNTALHCLAGDSHGRCRMNHCAIAAGDRPILIRCALQHPRNDIYGCAVQDEFAAPAVPCCRYFPGVFPAFSMPLPGGTHR